MNLATKPWLDVSRKNGECLKVSLRDAFELGDIADLELPPPERVSVVRLLCCIAEAALEDKKVKPTPKVWGEKEEKFLKEAAEAYLAKWGAAFQLDGDRPFLQVCLEENKTWSSLATLCTYRASGNNKTTFDKLGESRIIGWEDGAVGLITAQNFSRGGRCGQASALASPCCSGSPIHTLAMGETLRETVWKNLLEEKQWKALSGNTNWSKGRPSWEQYPESREGTVREGKTQETYLGNLVPVSRSIIIDWGANRAQIGRGVDYPPETKQPSVGIKHVKSEKEIVARRIGIPGEGGMWRELSAVLAPTENGVGGPEVLKDLGEGAITVWCGGMATNKAKIIDTKEWQTTIPAEYRGERSLKEYQEAMGRLTRLSQGLKTAEKEYRKALKISPKRGRNEALTCEFWASAELSVPTLLKEIQEEKFGERSWWSRKMREKARELLDRHLNQESPKQILAAAVAHKTFNQETA
jgi:CRISPR type I-E-associated protein CasA/Cse1